MQWQFSHLHSTMSRSTDCTPLAILHKSIFFLLFFAKVESVMTDALGGCQGGLFCKSLILKAS